MNMIELLKGIGGNMNLLKDFNKNNLPTFYLYAVVALIFGWLYSQIRRLIKARKKTLKKSSKQKAEGILFGKEKRKIVHSPSSQEGHIAVFGGSGSGKTSSLLIPTLRNWEGTFFTIDISGDICDNVTVPNKLVYEPACISSTPYNIFAPIDSLSREFDKNEALEQLAYLIMPDAENMSDASHFFHNEGRKILTASLIAFYHQGLDFIDICEKIIQLSWKDLFVAIDNIRNTKAIQYINSFEGTSEQNTAGCKQACDSCIKLFGTNDTIKQTIRRPKKGETCFSPKILETHNVFVKIEDYKLKLYAPLLQIITAQSLDYFSSRSNDRNNMILFCLDEFASLGKMDITDALRKLRKKHVRIMMITQSMADIDLIYGHDERMAMMNNFKFKVVLSADDTDTQEYFAKLVGQADTPKKSISRSGKKTTRTTNQVKDYIIPPSEFARLKEKLILLSPDGHIILRKNYYFKK